MAFPTYFKYTCGTELDAFRMIFYGNKPSGDASFGSSIRNDEVFPLGVCMPNYDHNNYFGRGAIKTVYYAHRRRRGCSGCGGHHCFCTKDRVKGKSVFYDSKKFWMRYKS